MFIFALARGCLHTVHVPHPFKFPLCSSLFSSLLFPFTHSLFSFSHSLTLTPFRMDTLLGLVGKDYVLIGADANAARSIMVFKQDEDKIVQLNSHTIMAQAGSNGDRTHFGEYIQKNVKLYELRNGFSLNTHGTRRTPYLSSSTFCCFSCP